MVSPRWRRLEGFPYPGEDWAVPSAHGRKAGASDKRDNTMIDLRILFAGSALALALAVATPALAQQGSPAPGTRPAGPAASQGTVTGRSLMTPEERSAFRTQMQQATPQDRQALWDQKHTELMQRAAERGVTLREPGARMGGSFHENGGAQGGREAGRGEGPMMGGRMMGAAPRGL